MGAIGGILGSIFGSNGPSGLEKTLSGEEANFYQQLNSYVGQQYGEQQAVLNQLQGIYSPIAAAGPNQAGFSAGELNALNTGAVDTAAGNYASAERNVASNLAGSGTNAGPSGVQQQIEAGVGSAAAGQASQAENQIQQENYAVGRQNWQQAMAGLSGVANDYNPEAFANAANNAGNSAFNAASNVRQQQNQASADLWSGIGGMLEGGFENIGSPGGGNPLTQFATGMFGL